MSEYQYVGFRAVDAPLDDKQLKFARQQSSRAEVSRWSFTADYNYSSFRGNVDGLLRQGYDVYLQYTNYGDREIKLRLPNGVPFSESIWSKYVVGERLQWTQDAKGRGGILTLNPYHELFDMADVVETQECLNSVVQARERLLSGDLRALYVFWLCAADDDDNDPAEMLEPPVPHGISDAATYGNEILSFYNLDPLLLVAAGDGVPPAPNAETEDQPVTNWVHSLGNERAKELLFSLLTGDTAGEKARLLADIRNSQFSVGWPTTDKQRSFAELLEKTGTLRSEANAKKALAAKKKAQQAAAEAERQRVNRMKDMAQSPDKWVRETEQLVAAGGTANYRAVADILFDLHEALGGNNGDQIARRQAAHLVKKYPTRSILKGSLRQRGLLE